MEITVTILCHSFDFLLLIILFFLVIFDLCRYLQNCLRNSLITWNIFFNFAQLTVYSKLILGLRMNVQMIHDIHEYSHNHNEL